MIKNGVLMEARQFGGTNLSASQFGRKMNNFDLPSIALKRQQKKFCNVFTAIEDNCNCSADKSENSQLKLLNALNLGIFLAEYLN